MMRHIFGTIKFFKLKYGMKIQSNFHMALPKKGLRFLIVVDKYKNKIQVRHMEKAI